MPRATAPPSNSRPAQPSTARPAGLRSQRPGPPNQSVQRSKVRLPQTSGRRYHAGTSARLRAARPRARGNLPCPPAITKSAWRRGVDTPERRLDPVPATRLSGAVLGDLGPVGFQGVTAESQGLTGLAISCRPVGAQDPAAAVRLSW